MNKSNNSTAETLLAQAEKALAILPEASTATSLAQADLEAQVEAAVRGFRDAATSPATWESYSRALRYVCGWTALRLGQPLAFPMPVSVVMLFVVDHFGQPERVNVGSGRSKVVLEWTFPADVDQALVDHGFKAKLGRLKMSTIDHRLWVLAWAHREKKLTSPTTDPGVRQLLSDCRKIALEIGDGPKQKTAATQIGLDAMLATCDDSLEGLRDRALLLFGWTSGGRRRSEIANAEVADLEWLDENTAIFRMRRSKTADDGPKPVKDEAALALKRWLEAAKITEGALFRRLWGPRVGAALSPGAIAAIVKRRAAQANLEGDFAGHSLRRGFVTEAGLNDTPLAQTMAMTGHRMTKSVIRYSEAGNIVGSKAADLLTLGRARKNPRKVTT